MGIKGVDVFSGAGGMSVGAAWAGVETTVAFDSDQHAAKTYQLNHAKTKVICEDVRKIENFSMYRPDGPCVVFGGPPCQGFSTSNQRTRNAFNENNWLFREFLRAVDEIKPDWVIFENVKGMIETANATFLRYVIQGLEQLDFSVSYGLLNAVDYGVPQKRNRLFVIGAKGGKKNILPINQTKKQVTVRDAISDLQALPNGASFEKLKYKCAARSDFAKHMRNGSQISYNHNVTKNAPHIIERYRHIPQGGNWENIPDGDL